MLNILLSALGLPKRVEVGPQTPTLRRVAMLESKTDDMQEQILALEAYAKELEKAIIALRKTIKSTKPKGRKP